jgi:choline-sulfatase
LSANTLIVMADEFARGFMGAANHPLAHTPNLDRLAQRGTRFTAAYCNSPICVPSRASFATGRYVHQIGAWDNAHPYVGDIPGWAHALCDAGQDVVSIGKLHYRNETDPTGFTQQIMPMHVVEGVGDLLGALRDPLPSRAGARLLATEVGRGDTSYSDYDTRITDAACTWIRQRGGRHPAAPWTLFVSLVCPHMPFRAPAPFYDLYAGVAVPPPLHGAKDRPRHPYFDGLATCLDYDSHFDAASREEAQRGYLGLCSFVDANIGRILTALDVEGLFGDTTVIFLSDHGESLGNRGIWGKCHLLEDAVGIPLIVAGGGMPAGALCDVPVSLVDIHPTLLDIAGIPIPAELPGRSLRAVASGNFVDRAVFSEFHAAGACAGAFMLRAGRHKLIHYAGLPPQFFDLASDPQELHDLSASPAHVGDQARLDRLLRRICDPDAVDARAKADQAALIARHGGREAVLRRGDFHASPVPGKTARFVSAA